MILAAFITVIVVLMLVAATSAAIAGLVMALSQFLEHNRPSAEVLATFNARVAADTAATLQRKKNKMRNATRQEDPGAGEEDAPEPGAGGALDAIGKYSPYLALLAAWIATCGSLFMSEALGWVPCLLCWYQRILMYPLALITATGLLRRDRHTRTYILVLSVPGIFMSSYHYLYQKTDLFRGMIPCTIGVPCSADYLNWLGGVVTIPFLALVAFLIITLATIASGLAFEPAAESQEEAGTQPPPRAPVLPVLGIIGAVTATFLIVGASYRNSAAAPTSTSTSTYTYTSTVSTDPAVIARGKTLFEQSCAVCHGLNGEGTPAGRPLTNSTVIQQGSDTQLIDLIRAGRAVQDPHNTTGLAMPAGGGRSDASVADLATLIAYMRSLTK